MTMQNTPPQIGLLGSPPPGGFNPGWQYPISDPGAALRNYLRERGQAGNPFNAEYQNAVEQQANSILAQYLAQMAQKSQAGGNLNDASLQQDFGQYIDQTMQNGGPQTTIGSAGQSVNTMSNMMADLAQRVSQNLNGKMPQNAQEWQATLAQMASQGQLKVTDMALAGYMSDPQRQAQFFQDLYSPALGPALTQGLGKAIAPMARNFSDNGAMLQGPSMGSFLDVLRGNPMRTPPPGSLPAGVAGPPNTPPPMMPPASMPSPMNPNGGGGTFAPPVTRDVSGMGGPAGGGSILGSPASGPNPQTAQQSGGGNPQTYYLPPPRGPQPPPTTFTLPPPPPPNAQAMLGQNPFQPQPNMGNDMWQRLLQLLHMGGR